MKETEENLNKQFGLTTLSLNNRTTVIVLTILIVILGVTTYVTMPKESYPEVKQPIVFIGTVHPGNSPVDMENLITRPIEKELNTISDVVEIKSTSVQDNSTIIVEFTTETDIEDALIKAKDAVDRAKPELPSDLQADPNVFEMNFSEFPVMNINLSGEFSLEELNEYAEYLEDEIEKLSEISKVEIRGVDEKEVRINVDPYQMEARNINFGDIENAITAENVTLSGGNILDNGVRRSIRVIGEFDDPQNLLDVVIKQEEGRIVYLADIAEIEFDYKEKANYARLMRNPVVMVDVIKRSGENLLIATEKINVILVGNSGFAEGWGLYAERLADELGLYDDAVDTIGMLSDQGARAARLVIDTGLHTKGWTRQQAVDYMMANTSWAEVDIENDINRYISWPGQATAYMLGMLEIRRLRDLAEQELGADFDLKAFHDRVVAFGGITLPMLHVSILAWIEEQQGN